LAHGLRPSPIAPAPNAGSDIETEGTLEILHEHRMDGRSLYHHILATDDGKRWPVDGVPRGLDLLTGDRVRLRGSPYLRGTRLLAAGASESGVAGLQVVAAAPLSNTFGAQKTLVILVNFSNDRSQPYTVTQAKATYAAVDTWFRENSYEQTSLAVDVVGWYTLPISNAGCDVAAIQLRATQAATAAGVKLAAYVRHIFAFPTTTNCGFSGLASIGGAPSSAWINGPRSTPNLAHEIGHTFGLYHSHLLACHPRVVDGTCTVQEYGDAIDVMGGNGHFNAFQKERLGWLGLGSSPPLTTVGASGTYTIDPYEFPGTGPKALKIPRGSNGQFLYVELRRNQGVDADLYRSGVFVHLGTVSDPNSSLLLDMVPETLTIVGDALLDVGKSFTDPLTGTTLTTISVSDTSATIVVGMGSMPSCIRSAPSVTASPDQGPAVPAGSVVTYTVSVTNNDSAECPSSVFSVEPVVVDGWQISADKPTPILGPGATGSTALEVTSPAVAAGSYAIAITVANTADPTLSTSVPVTYVVAAPPSSTGTTGTFADDFNRPDSPVLGNDWAVTGSLIIQSGEARNAASSASSVAVLPDLAGATQTVAASFASTNNNSAPRFSVLVRYQDPLNYYACYRQVGGSSVVRITKVQNGKETVLKSAGIGNPAANAFSTLSCQMSGTTLTLRVDGATKLSVSDATFSTGNAGYAISTKAASHRVDNFSASIQ